jgi:Secreted repeat of unknown function
MKMAAIRPADGPAPSHELAVQKKAGQQRRHRQAETGEVGAAVNVMAVIEEFSHDPSDKHDANGCITSDPPSYSSDAPRGDGPNGKDGASYLTGAKGMALYTFKKDTSVKSACAGDCVTNWPPRQTMLNLGQSWARRFLGLSDVPRG